MTDRAAQIEAMLDRGWEGRVNAWGPCTGYVYVIFTKGGEFMKIGFTKGDPRLRLANLQTGNHLHLKLATFLPGNPAMEKAIHGVLFTFRASGEWFRRDKDSSDILEDYIREGEASLS